MLVKHVLLSVGECLLKLCGAHEHSVISVRNGLCFRIVRDLYKYLTLPVDVLSKMCFNKMTHFL